MIFEYHCELGYKLRCDGFSLRQDFYQNDFSQAKIKIFVKPFFQSIDKFAISALHLTYQSDQLLLKIITTKLHSSKNENA